MLAKSRTGSFSSLKPEQWREGLAAGGGGATFPAPTADTGPSLEEQGFSGRPVTPDCSSGVLPPLRSLPQGPLLLACPGSPEEGAEAWASDHRASMQILRVPVCPSAGFGTPSSPLQPSAQKPPVQPRLPSVLLLWPPQTLAKPRPRLLSQGCVEWGLLRDRTCQKPREKKSVWAIHTFDHRRNQKLDTCGSGKAAVLLTRRIPKLAGSLYPSLF